MLAESRTAWKSAQEHGTHEGPSSMFFLDLTTNRRCIPILLLLYPWAPAAEVESVVHRDAIRSATVETSLRVATYLRQGAGSERE